VAFTDGQDLKGGKIAEALREAAKRLHSSMDTSRRALSCPNRRGELPGLSSERCSGLGEYEVAKALREGRQATALVDGNVLKSCEIAEVVGESFQGRALCDGQVLEGHEVAKASGRGPPRLLQRLRDKALKSCEIAKAVRKGLQAWAPSDGQDLEGCKVAQSIRKVLEKIAVLNAEVLHLGEISRKVEVGFECRLGF